MARMKRILPAVILLIFIGFSGYGQSTPSYDSDINRLIGKIKQYPGRGKLYDKLREYDSLANANDENRIESLRLSGQPDIWYEIYHVYRRMDNRQRDIFSLPENSLRRLNIKKADYQPYIDASKYKALAYQYAFGSKLLESGKPEDARQAYYELMKAAELDPTFSDLDKLIRKSILVGATNMEFEMHNRTRKAVSSSMIDHLSVIIWEFKNARYHQAKPSKPDDSFAFILRVILDDLKISPDKIAQLDYEEQRDIIKDGKVVDTISCMISEYRQLKKAMLGGSLEYVDKRTGQVVNRVPVRVESVFSNIYAVLQGDTDAASDQTRELLQSRKAAYPSDGQMILDATEEFAKKASQIILAE